MYFTIVLIKYVSLRESIWTDCTLHLNTCSQQTQDTYVFLYYVPITHSEFLQIIIIRLCTDHWVWAKVTQCLQMAVSSLPHWCSPCWHWLLSARCQSLRSSLPSSSSACLWWWSSSWASLVEEEQLRAPAAHINTVIIIAKKQHIRMYVTSIQSMVQWCHRYILFGSGEAKLDHKVGRLQWGSKCVKGKPTFIFIVSSNST